MTTEEITQKMIEITCEQLQIGRDQVKPAMSFVDDLGADSLDLAEIVMEIEEEFDLDIPEGEETGIKTIADAVAYIEKKISEKKGGE